MRIAYYLRFALFLSELYERPIWYALYWLCCLYLSFLLNILKILVIFLTCTNYAYCQKKSKKTSSALQKNNTKWFHRHGHFHISQAVPRHWFLWLWWIWNSNLNLLIDVVNEYSQTLKHNPPTSTSALCIMAHLNCTCFCYLHSIVIPHWYIYYRSGTCNGFYFKKGIILFQECWGFRNSQ